MINQPTRAALLSTCQSVAKVSVRWPTTIAVNFLRANRNKSSQWTGQGKYNWQWFGRHSRHLVRVNPDKNIFCRYVDMAWKLKSGRSLICILLAITHSLSHDNWIGPFVWLKFEVAIVWYLLTTNSFVVIWSCRVLGKESKRRNFTSDPRRLIVCVP